MRDRFTALKIILAALFSFACLSLALTAQSQQAPVTKTPAAAPRHDISGTWEPLNGFADGIQAQGVKAMPNDGKPEHQLPFTPLGLATQKTHKALQGVDSVLPAFYNDPRDKCEPIGFPRTDFYNMRQTQIMQDQYKVAILYEYAQTWRVIWTDGRQLPKVVDGGVSVDGQIREPRYFGYSVGKWVDDTTLVVDVVGTMGDDKTWMDTVGRPVSDALHVTETFHRVNHDRMEMTVVIDDPKMYTKPWVAMNKWPMKLADPHSDVMEMYCSPAEIEAYDREVGNPVSGPNVK
jgi:hypothetical protein